MKKKTKLNLALMLFLTITFCSIFFIINISNESDISIMEKEVKQVHNMNNNYSDQDLTVKEEPAIEWDYFIEKYYGQEITNISTNEKVISLTFDGGGDTGGTEKILKTLKNNDIEATFFLTGVFIEKYPEIVKRISDDGHEIANHSYSHPYLTELEKDKIVQELKQNKNLLESLEIQQKPFFRCPYGDRNPEILEIISENDFINIRWTIDSLGWQGSEGNMDSEKVVSRIAKKVSPGSIIMMHLGNNPKDMTNIDSESLSQVIEEMKENGYEFIILSELLEKYSE